MKKKLGKITMEPGARPEPHEIDTINYLAHLGKDILILEQTPHHGLHKPDIKMGGIEWEMKSLTRDGKYTVEHAFRDALHQSLYIIFDTRRAPERVEQNLVKQLIKIFNRINKPKRLLIISRQGMLDFKK